MAWNPNIPAVTNRVQDDLDAIRENFQHLDRLAERVDELQTVSELAELVDELETVSELAQAVDELQTVSELAPIANDLQTVSGLAPVAGELQAVSGLAQITDDLQVVSALAPYVQALLDSRIVEMGSNSNGEYVRWENGLQVCWRQETVGAVQDFTSTFNILDDRPFPAVFEEITGIQATVGVASDQPNTRGAFYIASAGVERNRWARLCIVRHANASGGTQTVYVNLFAIGRWK